MKSATDRGDVLAALSVVCLLLAVLTATFTGLPDNPDAEVEFQTTRAFAHHGNLALSSTPEARAIVAARFDVAPGGPGREGRFYSWFGVGQALAALPLYAAGAALARAFPELEARHAQAESHGAARSEYFAHLLVGWRNPLLTALTAGLLAFVALSLGAGRGVAWWAGITYGLCTFAWAQGRSTLSDVQAAFCLFLAFTALVLAGQASPRAVVARIAAWSACGLALGAAVLTRVAVAPMAMVIAVAALVQLARGRGSRGLLADLIAFAVPLAACLALFLWLNHARFGGVFRTGYEAGFLGLLFARPPWLGLAGLLVSPGRGLVWMAPGLLLLVFALQGGELSPEQRGQRRAWGLALAASALVCFALLAGMPGWHGAWTYGPRYLLPLLPLAWLGVAFALERARGWRLGLATALFALGLAVQLPAALVDTMTHQELAMQAARLRWPDDSIPGAPSRAAEDVRFERTLWSWSFAAPWAHWRILGHRLAGGGEVFSPQLFDVESQAPLELGEDRERGFHHLAWVDLRQRLGGPAWIGPVICGLWLALGLGLARAAFRGRVRPMDPGPARPAREPQAVPPSLR
jgi:hypothetical protein